MRKRHRNKRSRRMKVIRLWSYPQAVKALPYVRSITQSLRDRWLEAQSKRVIANRLARRGGRPSRDDMLASQVAEEAQSEAEERFTEALNELMGIDVYLLDPVRGVAFIPFQKNDALAWFVFDLFDPNEIKSWRFHEDPLEMRRPIKEVLHDEAVNPAMN